jgi:hypothetical protein
MVVTVLIESVGLMMDTWNISSILTHHTQISNRPDNAIHTLDTNNEAERSLKTQEPPIQPDLDP